VDPNLMRLGRAYDEAVAQLGGEAPPLADDDSSDGEEAAMGGAAASAAGEGGPAAPAPAQPLSLRIRWQAIGNGKFEPQNFYFLLMQQ